MKSFAVSVLIFGLANSLAVAGTVSFSPVSPSDQNNVVAGTLVTMDLTLSVDSLSEFNGADLILGSDDVAFDFAFASDWTDAMVNTSLFTLAEIGASGLYDQGGFFLGGSNPSAAVGTSLLLGRVTIDTTGLADATYTIQVDPNRDGTSVLILGLQGQGLLNESLAGSGSFTVVPEPATLALLGIGGLVTALRRRRTA